MKKNSIIFTSLVIWVGFFFFSPMIIGSICTNSDRTGFRANYLEGLALVCDFFGAKSAAFSLSFEAHKIAYDLIQVEIPYVGEEEGNDLRDKITQGEPRVARWGHEFTCTWSGGVESGIHKFYVPRDEEIAFREKIRMMTSQPTTPPAQKVKCPLQLQQREQTEKAEQGVDGKPPEAPQPPR